MTHPTHAQGRTNSTHYGIRDFQELQRETGHPKLRWHPPSLTNKPASASGGGQALIQQLDKALAEWLIIL